MMQDLPILSIVVLAIIQGLAELLPVSSSAHVVVAEKLMGLDPSSPAMTFLLVMLHTGTSFAVILYFWPRWKARFASADRGASVRALVLATAATGVVGYALKHLIEKVFLHGGDKAEIESLFSNLPLVAAALAAAGLLILWAGGAADGGRPIDDAAALRIGAVQGLCLPFRGFSRSGATISAALLGGVPRAAAEDFSFALAVIITPPVILREVMRLLKSTGGPVGAGMFVPGLLGMVFSFGAGLLALRWLSSWLEKGRWRWFGWYCLAASAAVFVLSTRSP
jgi:undecaprenyl-diphosphatase